LRVLLNLLTNARDAMGDHGRLTVRTENLYLDAPVGRYTRVAVGEYVCVTISDTGSGIAPEIQDRVFDPFFTTKQAERRRGSGLGLSVVQSIVDDHHGYVDLESEVGVGTTFRVYLPICREPVTAAESCEVAGGTERLLVVDDDAAQREVAGELLGQLGYEVAAVASGEEGVEYARTHTVDLVILDMVMPGIDGAEAYRQMLEEYPHQRAIILSGYADSSRVLLAQQLGAGAFVRKPVTMAVLAEEVRRELDRPATTAKLVRSEQ
jgi:CheY-like chemotaxis protein